MMIDVTTKIRKEQMEKWVGKKEDRHIVSGHIGTHLDTYKKRNIPIEYFKSEGVLIDVSSFCEKREVLISDVIDKDIPSSSFVLFKTSRISNFSYGSEEYFTNHPQLSADLIDWLIERKIRFIGVDCSGIRQGEEHKRADILCEEHGIYVIENLCNLESIKESKFTVYTMWIDDPSLTGLKCRVLVETDEVIK